MEILDPEDQNNHLILEKYLAEVLEKEPEALYRILHEFNFEQGDPKTVYLGKLQYAQCIKMLFIDQDRKPPEEFSDLGREIYEALEANISLENQIDLIVEHKESLLYIREHGLNDLLERVHSLSTQESDDPAIDAEFVVSLHQQEFDFPEDDDDLSELYYVWLTSMSSF